MGSCFDGLKGSCEKMLISLTGHPAAPANFDNVVSGLSTPKSPGSAGSPSRGQHVEMADVSFTVAPPPYAGDGNSAVSSAEAPMGDAALAGRRRAARSGCMDVLLQQDESNFTVPLWLYDKPAQKVFAICSMVSFAILGVVFMHSAVARLDQRISYTFRDTHKRFTLDADVDGPLQVSYVLSPFYANYRDYVESKSMFVWTSMLQIMGYNCERAEDWHDVAWRRANDPDFLSLLDNRSFFQPCGLAALSMFMDEFELYSVDEKKVIDLQQTDIALPADATIYEDKFKVSEDGLLLVNAPGYDFDGELSWLRPGPLFEHFKVWYRQPASPSVHQLWATIPDGLSRGTYEMRFSKNDAVWEQQWGVTSKQVVVSQTSSFGDAGAARVLGAVSFAICAMQVIYLIALCSSKSQLDGYRVA
eukprot:TRINITY_DN39964_c0_g1_i1.p1 TRINITY_DN39964_c0_g1~~TRINITY_DN39964_c0_g1_i1.p1  ORF type:complete len:417 (-),score=45.15 TRINITY_DN39964_c0_g1_i1:145-1395(-)